MDQLKSGKAMFIVALLVFGMFWGTSVPLNKMIVETGYRHFGILFWQMTISFGFLSGIILLAGGKPRIELRHWRVYLALAALGTVLPNIATYAAAPHLQGGVMAVLISLVPMFAFPMAVALKMEQFSWRRFIGLLVGLTAVVVLMAPEISSAEDTKLVFILLAMVPAAFYAMEGNYVAKLGIADLRPIEALLGASLLGAAVSLPLALMTGEFISPIGPYVRADYALVAASMINVLIYVGYVWLVGQAGAVFASQVAYLVTISGVIWSIVLLGERYSGELWIALSLVLVGVFLVQPRDET
ncbi:MAG: DMT family transporter [Halocynthiibacter sp.]